MQWQLFICSDCDTDDGVVIMLVPDDAHAHDAACPLDYCPGCDSHLSFANMGKVEVSGNALIHLKMREPAQPD